MRQDPHSQRSNHNNGGERSTKTEQKPATAPPAKPRDALDLSLREHFFRRPENVPSSLPTSWISRHLARAERVEGQQQGELYTKLHEALSAPSKHNITATSPTGDTQLTVENRDGNVFINVHHLLNRKESRTTGLHTHTQRTITEITHALRDYSRITGGTLRVELSANQVINEKLQHLLERTGFELQKNAPVTPGRRLLEGVGVLAAGYALLAGTFDACAIAGAMLWILASTKGKSYSIGFEIQTPKV